MLPRLGYERNHGLWQRPISALHQELDNIVDGARVRQVLFDNGKYITQLVAKLLVSHDALARMHEVYIALERVYLAIVGEIAKRMRSLPTRKRVRRETRVNECQVALVLRVLEVDEVLPELFGRDEAFVDERVARERANVAVELFGVVEVGGAFACDVAALFES